MPTVGVRLRKVRKEKGLTQTEVTGGRYSKEYVSQVELGKTKPSRKAVMLFAKYLDVDESYFETGVDPAGRERFENLVAKGEVQLEREESEEAIRLFDEARGIGEKAENHDLVWRAEVGRAWALHLSGEYHEASAVLKGARRYYEDRRPDSRELAVVLYRLARTREALGDHELALLLLEAALREVERGQLPAGRLRLQILRGLTTIHGKRHDLEAGRECAEEALKLAQDQDDRRAVAGTYWDAALLEEQRRDFARATEYALRARDILADLGDRRDRARLLKELGDIATRMGRPQDAVAYLEEGLGMVPDADDQVVRSGLLNGLAAARLSLGEARPSLEYAAQSLALMEGCEDQMATMGNSHVLRARAFLAEGRLRECREELEEAKRCVEPGEPLHSLSGCLLLEGDLLLAEGRVEQAAAAFRRSSELVQEVRW